MTQFGPYAVGEKVTEESLVGVNYLAHKLFAVVGDFPPDSRFVPAGTKRQQIDLNGVVISESCDGPDHEVSVMTWRTMVK